MSDAAGHSTTDPAVLADTAPPDGRAARWAGQRERRREEFVNAVLALVDADGPEVTTAQVTERLGLSRTKVYRYFTDAEELHRAVAARVETMLSAQLAPVFDLHGSPRDMIEGVVGAHVEWLTEHGNLYRYLALRAPTGIADIQQAIGRHLGEFIGTWMDALEVPSRSAGPLAHGIVGLVESATARWLDAPGDLDALDLTEDLSTWIWLLADGILRRDGVALDPDEPLVPAP